MRAAAAFLLLILFGFFPASANQPPQHGGPAFTHPGVAADADRYEAFLKSSWRAGKGNPAELRVAAEKLMAADPRAASRIYAEAVVADGKSSESWLGLARALLAVTPDPNKSSERYDLPLNASGAAYRAYERAGDAASRGRALAVLGEALERRSYWRPAIDALRASLALADSTDARAVRQAPRRARLPHDRLQDRGGAGAAASLPAVLRAAGRRQR